MWLMTDIWHGEPIDVTIMIANIGSAPAKIHTFRFGTTIEDAGRDLPFPPRGGFLKNGRSLSVGILGGGVTAEVFRVTDPLTLSNDELATIRNRSRFLYCFGNLVYQPEPGEGFHTTAFCMKRHLRQNAHVNDRGRFCVHRDPDYEYQD
jgi:hypothetical protein